MLIIDGYKNKSNNNTKNNTSFLTWLLFIISISIKILKANVRLNHPGGGSHRDSSDLTLK